jgi:hypothetical protein
VEKVIVALLMLVFFMIPEWIMQAAGIYRMGDQYYDPGFLGGISRWAIYLALLAGEGLVIYGIVKSFNGRNPEDDSQ